MTQQGVLALFKPGEELTQKIIGEATGISPGALSGQIRMLVDKGKLRVRRDGTRKFYTIVKIKKPESPVEPQEPPQEPGKPEKHETPNVEESVRILLGPGEKLKDIERPEVKEEVKMATKQVSIPEDQYKTLEAMAEVLGVQSAESATMELIKRFQDGQLSDTTDIMAKVMAATQGNVNTMRPSNPVQQQQAPQTTEQELYRMLDDMERRDLIRERMDLMRDRMRHGSNGGQQNTRQEYQRQPAPEPKTSLNMDKILEFTMMKDLMRGGGPDNGQNNMLNMMLAAKMLGGSEDQMMKLMVAMRDNDQKTYASIMDTLSKKMESQPKTDPITLYDKIYDADSKRRDAESKLLVKEIQDAVAKKGGDDTIDSVIIGTLKQRVAEDMLSKIENSGSAEKKSATAKMAEKFLDKFLNSEAGKEVSRGVTQEFRAHLDKRETIGQPQFIPEDAISQEEYDALVEAGIEPVRGELPITEGEFPPTVEDLEAQTTTEERGPLVIK